MKAHGVPWLIRHLAGEIALAEAVEGAKRDTRQYTKRQATWFRNQLPDFAWVAPPSARCCDRSAVAGIGEVKPGRVAVRYGRNAQSRSSPFQSIGASRYDAKIPCHVPSSGGAMKRRSRAGGEPVKTRRPRTATAKRRNARHAARRRGSAAAAPESELARLTRELHEAQEQQTATGEILKSISWIS